MLLPYVRAPDFMVCYYIYTSKQNTYSKNRINVGVVNVRPLQQIQTR